MKRTFVEIIRRINITKPIVTDMTTSNLNLTPLVGSIPKRKRSSNGNDKLEEGDSTKEELTAEEQIQKPKKQKATTKKRQGSTTRKSSISNISKCCRGGKSRGCYNSTPITTTAIIATTATITATRAAITTTTVHCCLGTKTINYKECGDDNDYDPDDDNNDVFKDEYNAGKD